MAHRVLKKTEKFGLQIGTAEKNFCKIYDKLIIDWDGIEKDFFDTDKILFEDLYKSDWPTYIQAMSQTMWSLGMDDEFTQRLKFSSKDTENNAFTIAGDLCASNKYFGLAFGFYDLAIGLHICKYGFQGLTDLLIVKAKQVQAAIEVNVDAYEEEFKFFNVIWSTYFSIGTKCSMYQFIDMQLDNKIYHIYDKNYNGDKKHEGLDVLIRFLDKRLRYEYFPSGKTNFLFRILEAALKYAMSRQVYRFKQAKYLISVAAELMKSVNQDTIVFKKIKDLYLLTKTIYWGEIISLTELRNVVQSYPKMPEILKLCPNLSDRLCKLKIDVTEEDPDLPEELLDTESKRSHLYDLIPLYGEQLDHSHIPEVCNIYRELEKVQLNYFRMTTVQHYSPQSPTSNICPPNYSQVKHHNQRRYQRKYYY